MEDKLVKYFESLRSERISKSEIMSLLCDDTHTKGFFPDYIKARSQGLTISESELATLISQELARHGPESLILRFESHKEKFHSSHYPKKRPRKVATDEPELKKKTKT